MDLLCIIVRWAVQSLNVIISNSLHAFFICQYPNGGDREGKHVFCMRKLFYACIVVLCNTIFVQAQSKSSETVYLKNGSIIKGEVVEMISNKQVKVKTADGSLFVYTTDEVEKIVKEKEEKRQYPFKTTNKDTYKTTGLRGIVELGYIAGDFSAPEFSLSLGYQINPYFFVGAGAGAQYLINAEGAAIPVFADLRGCMFLGMVSPFISLKIGYEKFIDIKYEDGGVYCSPTFGVKIMTTQRQAVNLGLGLTSSKTKGWNSDKGFTLKIGYEF